MCLNSIEVLLAMLSNRRRFANFFFQWVADRNTRLVFSIVPDITGRNIQPFGKSVIHYPRWVEAGYLIELMRITDFMNSFPSNKRQKLSALASLGLLRPSEPLMYDLWEVARDRMPIVHFLQKWARKRPS